MSGCVDKSLTEWAAGARIISHRPDQQNARDKMMTPIEIKNKWACNSKAYTTKEVGTGVHDFIKDILESADFSALKKLQ